MKFEPFALERFFARHEFTARFMMTASDPETTSVRELLALEPGADAALLDMRLGYTESRGHPALRVAIASLYSETQADEVLVHAGAQEPILGFAFAALGPGDAVVVQTPCYQSLVEVMRWTGAEVVPWEVHESERWQLNPDDLKALAPSHTKALVINVPHNPTGALLAAERQEALVALARARGWWVFSDEVYRGLERDIAKRLPAMCDIYERGVSTGALAKGWGLGGLRIGWAATRDGGLRAALEKVKDYTTICSPGPSELLAAIAIRHTESFWSKTRARIAAHVESFEAYLAHSQRFSWVRPEGGTMGFARVLRAADLPASSFCDRLVREAGVLLAPGALFLAPDTHVRIGLGRDGFGDGLAALMRAAP